VSVSIDSIEGWWHGKRTMTINRLSAEKDSKKTEIMGLDIVIYPEGIYKKRGFVSGVGAGRERELKYMIES
jgi:hypothetical protein